MEGKKLTIQIQTAIVVGVELCKKFSEVVTRFEKETFGKDSFDFGGAQLFIVVFIEFLEETDVIFFGVVIFVFLRFLVQSGIFIVREDAIT